MDVFRAFRWPVLQVAGGGSEVAPSRTLKDSRGRQLCVVVVVVVVLDWGPTLSPSVSPPTKNGGPSSQKSDKDMRSGLRRDDSARRYVRSRGFR